MRLTLIKSDSTVYTDDWVCVVPGIVDLIPEGVSVLQWNNMAGWIEFKEDSFGENKPINQRIAELPTWAVACQLMGVDVYTAQQEAAALIESPSLLPSMTVDNIPIAVI